MRLLIKLGDGRAIMFLGKKAATRAWKSLQSAAIVKIEEDSKGCLKAVLPLADHSLMNCASVVIVARENGPEFASWRAETEKLAKERQDQQAQEARQLVLNFRDLLSSGSSISHPNDSDDRFHDDPFAGWTSTRKDETEQ